MSPVIMSPAIISPAVISPAVMGTGCRAAHRRPIYATQICLNINIGCFLKIIALLIHAQSSYRGTRYGERHLFIFDSDSESFISDSDSGTVKSIYEDYRRFF